MEIKKTVLTEEGLRNLEAELEQLKNVTRREVAEKLKVARGYGDLSENAEYDEAKNEQAIVEAKIAEIEATLKNVVVVNESELSTEHVSLGNKVVLKSIDDGKIIKLSLVGSKEVNIREGKVSDESPIGKACIGAKLGETIEVDAPAGIKKYIIEEIDK